MTEATAECQTEQTQTEQPKMPPPLTPEQQHNIRMHLHNSLVKEYVQLQSAIQSLPMPKDCFNEVFRFLDTGMLWLKEAIMFAPLINRMPESTATPSESPACEPIADQAPVEEAAA